MNRVGRGFLFLTIAYDKEGSVMASKSRLGSGLGKIPKYVDLDAPTPSNKDPWNTKLFLASSNPSTSSSGSKKPKKARNPTRKEYEDASYTTWEYVLQYYKVRLLEMLNREFLDNGFDRFINMCANLG